MEIFAEIGAEWCLLYEEAGANENECWLIVILNYIENK